MTKMTDILIIDLMGPATIVARDTEISEALRMIKTEKIDFLSVVDDKHKLIGALSETNFIKLVKHEPSSLIGDPVWFDSIEPEAGKQTVETIMTTNITTIKPDENAGTALKIMNAVGYKLLHVVDSEGKLLGVVGIKDIFEKLLGV